MDSDDSINIDESGALEISCIPDCEESLKPVIGRVFVTIDEGVAFYRAYGVACGFSSRKSTIKREEDDTIRLRYVVCSRSGNHVFSYENTPNGGIHNKRKRRTSSCRIGCKAMICFRFTTGVGFVINKFEESHNHEMVSRGYRPLMKMNRIIDHGHHLFLARCAKANVGASRAFHIFKNLLGSYDHVRVRKIDFKNMYRDIKCKTVGLDSEMILEKFRFLSQKNSGFFYAYFEDEDKDLSRLFWADATAIQNYKIFGDAVSFDATYSTNKYCMVFTPFTGRDSHGWCVNFGAGLLSHENADSYSWLLYKFVECMGAAPTMLITDQDRGIRAAVENVIPGTRHRFCMWHIMSKLGDKVPRSLHDSDGFIQEFTELVWSDLYGQSDFEMKWIDIMERYNLQGHKWFESMYEIRASWIPAYFKDVKMSGLFRTTSLSESENGFFRRYMNKHSNLCELYMRFETAIEVQRHEHDSRSLVDQTSSHAMITKLPIEKHASTIYTNDMFLDVQKEIECSIIFCTIQNKVSYPDIVTYDVDEDALGVFKVIYDMKEQHLDCECKYFIIHGLVCRHMFAVMKVCKVNCIPEKYIVNRWTRKACAIFHNSGQNQFAIGNIGSSSSTDGIFALACNCVGICIGNLEKSQELHTLLDCFYKKHLDKVISVNSEKGKNLFVEQYYESNIPTEAKVGEPKTSKTKGSCSRLTSRKETAIKRMEKPKRLCRKCLTWGHHDSRNCGKVLEQ